MLRVVFTVALAVAVLGVATPAVEYAGVERSDTQVRAVVETLTERARTLAAAEDALPPGERPARRTVEVTLPSGGFASAQLRSFSIGPPPAATRDATGGATGVRDRRPGPATTQFAWRVAGGTRHTVRVDGIRIRASAPGGLTLAGGGDHLLVLRLVEREGDRVVLVSRRRST